MKINLQVPSWYFIFMSRTWKKGAVPIHEFGSQIACCASPKGLVYIAGENQEVAVYDVFEDRWEDLPEIAGKDWLGESLLY